MQCIRRHPAEAKGSTRMAQELIMVLKETILPMAERLDRGRVLLPGAAGKKPVGRFLPAHVDPPAEKDLSAMQMGIGPYGAHSSPLEWVFGFRIFVQQAAPPMALSVVQRATPQRIHGAA